MSRVITIENLCKEYRLGVISHGTLTSDLQSWWAKLRGKEDPNTRINTAPDNHQRQMVEGNRFWALRDINLEIEQGDILGIIGKNGAGKSTLLKVLSRVTAPTYGNVKIKGRIASLLEVGTGFHPELTGMENIFLNGAILGMSKIEIRQKLDEIIEFSGVEQFIDTPVKRYSSGMKVRLGFAVAAHLEPEILIVDEVLAVGDAEFRKKCLGKMHTVSKEGRTILFVSHSMPSVLNLCSHVIIMNDGRITKQGQAKDMIEYYTADIHPMNVKENSVYKIKENSTNGDALIRMIEMKVEGQNTSLIRSGQNLEFIIHYDTKAELKNWNIAIGIYDKNNDKIIHADTIYSNNNFTLSNKGLIKFTLYRLPLPSDYYYANFSLRIKSHLSDYIKKGIVFYVEEGDYYGNGKVPSSKDTKILTNYTFDNL